MATESDPNKFTDAEIEDLMEFVQTVLTLCDGDPDLAIELEALALTAGEILGMFEKEDEDEE